MPATFNYRGDGVEQFSTTLPPNFECNSPYLPRSESKAMTELSLCKARITLGPDVNTGTCTIIHIL